MDGSVDQGRDGSGIDSPRCSAVVGRRWAAVGGSAGGEASYTCPTCKTRCTTKQLIKLFYAFEIPEYAVAAEVEAAAVARQEGGGTNR